MASRDPEQPQPKYVSLRLLAFVITLLIAVPLAQMRFAPLHALMIGFDVAALVFLTSCIPLLRLARDATLAAHAATEDGSRILLIVIAGIVCLTVLGAVASEFSGGAGHLDLHAAALVTVTLGLAWVFSNLIYALHYAHLHYSPAPEGGLDFPGTVQPDYWDFIYFAFTLGMTFQTSDIVINSPDIRRVVTLHSLAAFVFNLGIIGFTINLLGGLGG
jgi:uncharacterized membrane protein